MSSPIQPTPPSYFSLEAFRKESNTLSSQYLIKRALVSLQKLAIPSAQGFSIPEEWISNIVSGLKSRKPRFAISPEISLRQNRIKALENFLLALRDPKNSTNTLQTQFQSLGKPVQALLCKWIWHAHQEPQEEPPYGQNQILENPRCLLTFIDDNGNNIIERCIELASIESLDCVMTKCDRETFKRVEPPTLDRTFQETLYTAVAIKFANTRLWDVLPFMDSIDDPYLRFEIAKCYAKQSSHEVAEYIEGFKITDKRHLFEIAKICALHNGESISPNISRFGITDPIDLFNIAKICAQGHGYWTAYYIQNFGITDQEHLFEIAKLCAKQNGWRTVMYVFNFRLANEKHRFEVAKLCAELHGGTVAENIRNFCITDPELLFKIAKLCAEENGKATIEHIQNFESIGPNRLFEIAKFCALQDGASILPLIHAKFHSLTTEQKTRLENICVWSMASSFHLSDAAKEHFKTKIFPSVREAFLLKKYQFFMEAFRAPEGENESQLRQRRDLAILTTEPENITELSPQAIIKLCAIQYILDEYMGNPIDISIQNTYIQILTYRNVTVLCSFLLETSSYIQNPQAMESYRALISTKHTPSGIVYLRLPMLMIGKWQAEYAGATEIENACKQIQSYIIKHKSPFKNAHSGLMQTWLLICLTFEHRSELSNKEKIQLLHKTLNPECSTDDLQRRLSYIQALLMMQQQEALKKITIEPIENLTEYLSDCITEALSQDPYLGLDIVDHLTEKYLSTLATMRIPNAWSTYAAQIQQTNNESVQKAFQHALIHILNGTHREARYDEKSSPHIIRIVQKHQAVWNQWKAPHEGQVVSLDITEQRTSFSFQDYLKTKYEDGHLSIADGTSLEFLTSVIKGSEDADQKQLECQEMAAKGENPLLRAQDLLIHLYRSSCSETEILEKKEEFIAAIQALQGYEIANDLQGLLNDCLKTQAHEQKVLVVDTDDWQDLFLCGTEVAGSCQRIDGDPARNQCLLAYLIDGKNRMLAVKDPVSGKILARALFRMLWDPIREQPVLFRDRIYPTPCLPAYERALDDLAKKRAKDLALPLYIQGARMTSIQSLGSQAPFEYEDAAGGLRVNGIFTIGGAQEIPLE